MVGRTDVGCRACCSVCTEDYEPADGNALDDDFTTLDPDWSPWITTDTHGVSGGRMTYQWNGDPSADYGYGVLARGYSDPFEAQPDGLLLIVEVENYETADSIRSGIFLGVSGARAYGILARWDDGDYVFVLNGIEGTVAQAPVSGDKLTVKICHIGGSIYGQYYYINEELVYSYEGTYHGSGSTHVHVWLYGDGPGGTVIGEWDNCSIHIGNP